MASLKKRKISGKTYYYLSHTYREGGKVKNKEIYLGTKQPQNFDVIKKNFISEIYNQKWFSVFDKMKKSYLKEQNKLPKEIKEKEVENFVVKFTYNTNRIEGSRLTLKETDDLLERGISPKSKPVSDIREAEAHKKVFYEAMEHKGELSLQVILKWHKDLFSETKPGIEGKLRDYQVAISGSKFMPPSPVDIYPMVNEFFRWYDKEKVRMHPVELAALVHLKFVTIHPFGDGNGRMSRLMMNFVLHKHDYPMLDIKYENRGSYYTALERSQLKQNDNIFILWFFKKYVKENKRLSIVK